MLKVKNPDWKTYQTRLRRANSKKNRLKQGLKGAVWLSLLLAVVYGIAFFIPGAARFHLGKKSREPSDNETEHQDSNKKRLDKNDLQTLFADQTFLNRTKRRFHFVLDGQTLVASTTLDSSLQTYLMENLDRENSKYIGIVIMDPATGKVLSMVGFDKANPSGNPCIDNRFLAASIFKIVTAAAAVEKCGLGPKTILTYNGSKYTLYRSQLKNRQNRYTNKITFRDSFAQSINPVFGKIGAQCLGKIEMEKYATAFGFNRNIHFEIPLSPSFVSLSDDSYQLAEIASGFNRETRLSPLHGALIAAVLFNQGQLIEPTIIEEITDENGEALYHSRFITLNRVISSRSANIVYDLMKSAIKSGTPKKAFKGYRRDKILSKLYIGGKTGSIYNMPHDAKYDWFVGFAEKKDGPGKIVLSIVVVHDKYIGKRASQYARIAIRQYFRNYFVNRGKKLKNSKS